MQVASLRVFQYRNFDSEEIVFSPATNIFLGSNGQGKTNLLEALYLLAYGKSFRTSVPQDCIQLGKDQGFVEGIVEVGPLERQLRVLTSTVGKKLMVGGKTVALDEFVGNLHALAFTNEHMRIIRGGPVERRSFLDRAMITIYPGYTRELASYRKTLKHRNAILAQRREGGQPAEPSLESWDEKLILDGSRITMRRRDYIDEMKQELPGGLFGRETLKIKYLSTVSDEKMERQPLQTEFRRRLLQRRSYDQKVGFTTVGPHRDEIKLHLNGKSLLNFASAGQQRSSLIALYFAQMAIHRRIHGFFPVFLLDDMEAELDAARMKTFLDYLSSRTQVFLTTAKEPLLVSLSSERLKLTIKAGTVRSLASS